MRKSRLFFTFILFIVQLFVFAQTKTEEFKAFKEKYAGKEFDYNASWSGDCRWNSNSPY